MECSETRVRLGCMSTSLINPYEGLTGGQWLRGNLHTHTRFSDGLRDTQSVIDDYAARGYGFLMISDHDVYTSRTDYEKCDAKGLVLIPGNEITNEAQHLLHVNANQTIRPIAQRQAVIVAATSDHSFIIVNHPNWGRDFDHCPTGMLRQWAGYVGMEIYNGIIGRDIGSSYAMNKWDIVLSDDRQVWGFANDDSHIAEDVGLGWNVVYVKNRTVEDVIDALRYGRFYCSTGVDISAIRVEGMRVTIETGNADRIVVLGKFGRRLAVVNDRRIDYNVTESRGYVRFECWGPGEQFAWTQPLFVSHYGSAEYM